jgi:glyceraldehyde-3-phosphate dehydrogenase (NADP+)
MKMFLAGEWLDRDKKAEVRHPFDGRVIDVVPQANATDVDVALTGLRHGAEVMRRMPALERFRILRRAADAVAVQQEELGRLISLEEGKTLAEGIGEAKRATDTLELSAEEARRLTGEMIPLDAAPGGAGQFGFTLRVPCGIVAAITPFNFPLNLVCHKVGPAIAGGNAVLVKPASDTPLSALRLVEILLASGLPAEAIACLTGPGGELGDAICKDSRVRKISFTGSVEVGEKICHVAGLKRVTMELGSNSPIIVLPDADLAKVAETVALTGYSNAGQTCISTQRVIAFDPNYGDLVEAVRARVEQIHYGDPLQPGIQMGPMIRERDAQRVSKWIEEAKGQGARVISGGTSAGTLMAPTLIADVKPEMRISCDELFGPAVGVTRAGSAEEALALANDSRYGLSAGVFTQDIDAALRMARNLESGNIHINWGPSWRADLMPYGGLKMSGLGKEGPKYAIREMTEEKMVVIHTPE